MKIKLLGISELIYLFISFIALLVAFFKISNNYVMNMYILIAVFVYIFLLTLKRSNFSIYQAYLISYFVFLLGRVFLNCIGKFNLKYMNHFQRVYMTDKEALLTINSLLVFLIGTSYAWLLLGEEIQESNFNNCSQIKINNLLKILFYIYLVLFVGKLVYVFRYVRQYGYLAIFNGTIASIKVPAIFNGAATITECLYILLLFYNRDIKSFKLYSGLLLVAGGVKMLTGQRGYGLVLFLYILCLYSRYYRKLKITNWKIIILGLFLPLLIQVIYNLRYGIDYSIAELIKNNVYFQTLESLGGPIETVGSTISHNSEFTNKIPFLLGYFVDFFKHEPAGQVIEDITHGNYLGDHLTYAINKNIFFAGHGTGTSIVAETYSSFNGMLLFVFLFAFFACMIILKISREQYKNIYVYALSYYLLTDFIYSPRDSVFKSLRNVVFAFVLCFIVKRFEIKGKGLEESLRKT